MAIVLRTASNPLGVANTARSQIWTVDKDMPVFNIADMDQIISESVSQQRFNLLLMSLFAVIALLLASVGIYGVMSYSVTQRTHEIGIRMALGAQAGDVLKMVVRQGMTLVLIGLSAGIVAAFALTRLIASLLFSTSVTDPVTFVGISVLLGAVAFVANLIPARRATKIDPLIALRYE